MEDNTQLLLVLMAKFIPSDMVIDPHVFHLKTAITLCRHSIDIYNVMDSGYVGYDGALGHGDKQDVKEPKLVRGMNRHVRTMYMCGSRYTSY